MSTDREMLEWAAKAAGIVGQVEEFYLRLGDKEPILAVGTDNGGYGVWDPLTDDGDALRLAVKLNIASAVDETAASAMVSLDEVSWCDLKEVSNDPYAATRRAIVRAAAEIGKEKK